MIRVHVIPVPVPTPACMRSIATRPDETFLRLQTSISGSCHAAHGSRIHDSPYRPTVRRASLGSRRWAITTVGGWLLSRAVQYSTPTASGTARNGAGWDGAGRDGAVRCGAGRCGSVRCGSVRCGAVRLMGGRYSTAYRIQPGPRRHTLAPTIRDVMRWYTCDGCDSTGLDCTVAGHRLPSTSHARPDCMLLPTLAT